MRNRLILSLLAMVGGPLLGCGALAGCAMTPQHASLQTPPPIPTPPDTPVFFQEWSAALDPAALATIATTATAANKLPNAPILITGSADTIGSARANIDLSKTRAQVVADQMVADGVARRRITTKATGETAAPAQIPGMPAQFSRRVMIRIEGQ